MAELFKIVRYKGNFKDMEQEVSDALADGFFIEFTGMSEDNYPVIMLAKQPPETYEHRIKGSDAYPTDKQLGYIRWAFHAQESDVERYRLTKTECSDLISFHKDTSEGASLDTAQLKLAVEILRGKEESTITPPPIENSAPAKFDANIPF